MSKQVRLLAREQQKRGKKFSTKNLIPTIPHFSTLVFGILIGIFASCLTLFMFATSDITLKLPTLPISKVEPKTKKVQEAKAEQEPRFDFYTELAKNDSESVKDLNSAPKTINGYIVQAGMFRKISDADALRARLTLNGYTAKIEAIKQRDGEIWQRVILGTYKTEQQARSIQQKLKSIEIESILVLKYAE